MKPTIHPLAVVAFGLTLAQINDIVGILASVIALGYTLWRWRKDAKAPSGP